MKKEEEDEPYNFFGIFRNKKHGTFNSAVADVKDISSNIEVGGHNSG